jgi:acyl-CoA thioester hydrolase
MINYEINIRVRYVETDKMGHVHHSNFITWFEEARIQFCDSIGVPYKYLEDIGYYSPVTKVQVNYLQPAYFDDRLRICICMREPLRARFMIEYEVKRGEDLLATGNSEHVFVNREKRLTKPPREFVEAIAKKFEEYK